MRHGPTADRHRYHLLPARRGGFGQLLLRSPVLRRLLCRVRGGAGRGPGQRLSCRPGRCIVPTAMGSRFVDLLPARGVRWTLAPWQRYCRALAGAVAAADALCLRLPGVAGWHAARLAPPGEPTMFELIGDPLATALGSPRRGSTVCSSIAARAGSCAAARSAPTSAPTICSSAIRPPRGPRPRRSRASGSSAAGCGPRALRPGARTACS